MVRHLQGSWSNVIMLKELLKSLPPHETTGRLDLEIGGVSYDSRKVEPGDLFVCIRGLKADGHDFAPQAVQRGAAALVVERPLEMIGVTQVRVGNPREALALLSCSFFGNPSASLNLIGVTGTNGKTTTAHMIEAIGAEAGYTTGLIGTVYVKVADQIQPARWTTPESLDLQRLLREMVDRGVQWASMEVSSHALDLHRVTGTEFDQAVFTNITRDHFDFHKDFRQYLEAKARLFTGLGTNNRKAPPKAAVINADDPNAEEFARRSHVKVITFGVESPAEVKAENIELKSLGSRFTVRSPWGSFPVHLRLPGMFNVSNALAAVTAVLHAGIAPEVVAAAMEKFTKVPGRYEVIDCGQDFTVLVDFAHNPDALANILRIPPQSETGRKIVVFGAEGGKDRGKRPIMGQMAMKHADYCIISSDNIYDEDPEAIAHEVEQGVSAAGKAPAYEVIIDRHDAIARALDVARAGDLVIIAGKGHEIYQIIKGHKRPFDDRVVVRELLEERWGGK